MSSVKLELARRMAELRSATFRSQLSVQQKDFSGLPHNNLTQKTPRALWTYKSSKRKLL